MSKSDAKRDNPPALSDLPAVDHLLKQPAITELLADYPRGELLHVVRAVLDERRTALRAGQMVDIAVPALALAIRQRLYERSRPHLRRVINATGTVLHTGLGRAPLAEEAIDALVDAAGYCNLEIDLDTGCRGSRHDHLRDLLCELCNVEDAVVVNNNAAATYLALNTFAAGREVLISRGQLVEIGGSYRLPDIMAAAQCRMVEVGTTNRTRISDYERALSADTAILLRVHCSNYRIEGFTESASLAELVELGRRHNILVVDDLGSGLLTTDLPWPVPPDGDEAQAFPSRPADWDEPTVADSIATGADITLFSGDKLLGGPQAGILLGRAALTKALRQNPLARTFRPDKLTLAALEATFRLFRDPEALLRRLPVYRMLALSPDELENAARALAGDLARVVPDAEITGVEDYSEAGGGSLATEPFPTWVVMVRVPDCPAERLAAALRQRDLPIICRVRDEALIFDPRTLSPEDADQIPAAVAEAVREVGSA